MYAVLISSIVFFHVNITVLREVIHFTELPHWSCYRPTTASLHTYVLNTTEMMFTIVLDRSVKRKTCIYILKK